MAYTHRQNTLMFPIMLSIGVISLIAAIILIIYAISADVVYIWQSMSIVGCGLFLGIFAFGFKYLQISDDGTNNQLIIQFGYNIPCFCGLNKICIPYDMIIRYQAIQSKWYYPRGCRKCGNTLYFNASGYGKNHCCHRCCCCQTYCEERSNTDMIYVELHENNPLKCCIRDVMISTDDRTGLVDLFASKDVIMLQTKNTDEIDGDDNNKQLDTIEMR
eukprot:235120_1